MAFYAEQIVRAYDPDAGEVREYLPKEKLPFADGTPGLHNWIKYGKITTDDPQYLTDRNSMRKKSKRYAVDSRGNRISDADLPRVNAEREVNSIQDYKRLIHRARALGLEGKYASVADLRKALIQVLTPQHKTELIRRGVIKEASGPQMEKPRQLVSEEMSLEELRDMCETRGLKWKGRNKAYLADLLNEAIG